MRDTAAALYGFFSGFGIPAYVEETVPDNAALPYLTYELKEPEPGGNTSLKARVWYEGTGFGPIVDKVGQIKQAIGQGVSLPVQTGAIWLWPDTNFCQFQPTDEPKLKVAYLSLILGGYKM